MMGKKSLSALKSVNAKLLKSLIMMLSQKAKLQSSAMSRMYDTKKIC